MGVLAERSVVGVHVNSGSTCNSDLVLAPLRDSSVAHNLDGGGRLSTLGLEIPEIGVGHAKLGVEVVKAIDDVTEVGIVDMG